MLGELDVLKRLISLDWNEGGLCSRIFWVVTLVIALADVRELILIMPLNFAPYMAE